MEASDTVRHRAALHGSYATTTLSLDTDLHRGEDQRPVPHPLEGGKHKAIVPLDGDEGRVMILREQGQACAEGPQAHKT